MGASILVNKEIIVKNLLDINHISTTICSCLSTGQIHPRPVLPLQLIWVHLYKLKIANLMNICIY